MPRCYGTIHCWDIVHEINWYCIYTCIFPFGHGIRSLYVFGTENINDYKEKCICTFCVELSHVRVSVPLIILSRCRMSAPPVLSVLWRWVWGSCWDPGGSFWSAACWTVGPSTERKRPMTRVAVPVCFPRFRLMPMAITSVAEPEPLLFGQSRCEGPAPAPT